MEEGLIGEIEDPFEAVKWQQVLGGERFLRQLKDHWNQRVERPKNHGQKRNWSAFGAEQVLDPELRAGPFTKASGWEALGHTKGHSRHRCDFYIPNERSKRLWIKPLHPRAREWLCAPQLPPECQTGQRPEGAGARCALKMKQLHSCVRPCVAYPIGARPKAAKIHSGPYYVWSHLGR